MGTHIQDADRGRASERVQLFTRAQAESRKDAEQAEQLLMSRLS